MTIDVDLKMSRGGSRDIDNSEIAGLGSEKTPFIQGNNYTIVDHCGPLLVSLVTWNIAEQAHVHSCKKWVLLIKYK